MKIVIRSKKDIEYGVNGIIERYVWIRNKINKTSAYSTSETEERLELLKERTILNNILRQLDIQDFELDNEENDFSID